MKTFKQFVFEADSSLRRRKAPPTQKQPTSPDLDKDVETKTSKFPVPGARTLKVLKGVTKAGLVGAALYGASQTELGKHFTQGLKNTFNLVPYNKEIKSYAEPAVKSFKDYIGSKESTPTNSTSQVAPTTQKTNVPMPPRRPTKVK